MFTGSMNLLNVLLVRVLSICLVTALLLTSVLSPIPAFAVISNGAAAVDALGQNDSELVGPQPIYTKSGANNAPNKLGFNSTSQNSLSLLDSTNHRYFVSDSVNHRVLVFNLNNDNTFPDRIPDYVIGQPNFYSNTAANTQSGLNLPGDLEFDALTSRLFVAELTGQRVKIFDLSSGITNGMNAANVLGQITWTGATAANTQSGFSTPLGLAYDSVGQRLFVASFNQNQVKVFDLSDGITDGENAVNVLGQTLFTNVAAANTQIGLNGPADVEYEADRKYLYVSNTTSHRVVIYDLNDGITDGEPALKVLGQSTFTGASAANTQTGLNAPMGLAYDNTGNRLFVGEASGHRVKIFDLNVIDDGEEAAYVIGQSGFTTATAANTQAGINTARGVEYDTAHDWLYVSQQGSHRISVFNVASSTMTNGANAIDLLGQYDDAASPEPVYTKSTANNGPNKYGLSIIGDVNQVAFDYVDNRMFTVDANNNRVLVFNLETNGTLTDRIPDYVIGQPNFYTSTASTTQSGLNAPRGLAYDPVNKRLFVSQTTGNRVSIFNLSSGITNGMNAANVLGQTTWTDITAANSQAGLNGPAAMAYATSTGQLFIVEPTGNRVKVFEVGTSTSDGMNASSVLGQTDFSGANAANSQVGMNLPRGVAYDPVRKYLFVGQHSGNKITVYNLADGVTDGEAAIHVLGQATYTTATAALTSTGLSAPFGIDYDATHQKLYVADVTNKRVLGYDVSTITDGESAVHVIGQPDYSTNTASLTQTGIGTPVTVTYNSLAEQIVVSDSLYHRITIYDASSGGLISVAGRLLDALSGALTGRIIGLGVDGSLMATTTTDGTGNFSFSNLIISSGSVVTAYEKGVTEKALTLTVSDGSNISGLVVTEGMLKAQCTSTCPITNTHFRIGVSGGDTDISTLYSGAGTVITTNGGYTFNVPSGTTYTPGGTLVVGTSATSSTLLIGGTFTGAANSIVVNGNLTIDSGATFSATSKSTSVRGILNNAGTWISNGGNLVSQTSSSTWVFGDTSSSLYVNDPGLVGYWSFDEGTGTTASDASGHGNTGTLTNMASPVTTSSSWTTSGKIKGALNFDGTNDSVITSLTPTAYTALTFSAWVNLTATGSYPMVLSYGSNADGVPELRFNASTGRIEFVRRNNNAGITDSANLVGTGWHHLVGMANGSVLSLYRDGVLVATSSTAHNLNSAAGSPLAIGQRSNSEGGVFPLTGSIDEVRVYNRLLSDAEIVELATGIHPRSGTSTLTLGSAFTTNNVVFNNATLDVSASNYALSVSGNFSNLGGVFVPHTGTVTLNGTNQSIYGSSTFNNLSKTATTDSTLSFEASSTQSVTGTLTMVGTSPATLNLRSLTSGSQWNIDPSGTRGISRVDVQDSNNINATVIDAIGDDSGNNINWSFTAAPVVSDSGSGGCSTLIYTEGNTTYQNRCGVISVVGVNNTAPVSGGSTSNTINSTSTASSTDSAATSTSATTNSCRTGDLYDMYTGKACLNPGVTTTTTTITTTTVNPSQFKFIRDLKLGSTGEDVRQLQKLLNSRGFTVSTSGAGSTGEETATFATKTKAALIRFQKLNFISPAVGYFGPITRAFVNR